MRKLTDEEKAVFGHDAQIGEDGKVIEQGIGSAKNPSASHVRALQLEEQRKLASKGDPVGMENVAKLLGELVQQMKQKDF
jgi:hypothetical protein